MKNLNTYQKVALAIAALVILIIQFIKFLDEGVEGASWILSLAISALLFMPILSDAEDIINSIKSKLPKQKESYDSKSEKNTNAVNVVFKNLGSRAEKLHQYIAQKGAVNTIPLFNVISDRWFPSVAAAVIFTYCVARKCDESDYYETEEFKKLNGMLFNLLMSVSKHQDKLIAGTQSDDEIMSNVMGIISAARKATDFMFSNIMNDDLNEPDLPIHKFIQSACGFTDEYYSGLAIDVKRHLNGVFVEYSNNNRLM